MATPPLTLADDGPVALTLDALVTLLQAAFDGTARLVGAPMTVLMYTPPTSAPIPRPTCRLFAPDEYLERLAATARANVWADSPMDRYGFRCEYLPVTVSGGAIALADMERQVRRDSWLLQKTLSDIRNIRVTNDGVPVVAELGKHIHTRNNIGLYQQDAAQVTITLEGEFSARKSLLASTGL